jgi:signal recognition particle receptor subunit beta
VGYIFLIDARREAELEYTNYVISNLISVHEVPWTIAVTNIDKSGKKVPPKIKSVLDLPKGRTLLTCDVTNKDDVREVVMSIKSIKNK